MDLNMCTERDKDENTLDYILCTFLWCVVIYFNSQGLWWLKTGCEASSPSTHSRTTCCSSKRASKLGRFGDWSGFECCLVFLAPDTRLWVFQKLLIFRDFHAQPSLPPAQSGLKSGGYVVGSSSLGKTSCWCQWSTEEGQTQGSRQQRGNSNSLLRLKPCRRDQRWTRSPSNFENNWPHSSQGATLCLSPLTSKKRNSRMQFATDTQLARRKIGNTLWPERTHCLPWHFDCQRK